MKLIWCRNCGDIVALRVGKPRRCECGASSGQYIDEINAAISGPCRPLGVANSTLALALVEQKLHGDLPSGLGRRFEAFVIPDGAPSVKRLL